MMGNAAVLIARASPPTGAASRPRLPDFENRWPAREKTPHTRR